MMRLNLAERTRIAFIGAKRSQRASVARFLYSPLVRWRFGSSTLGQLLIVPQDLRTSDPSFWQELRLGQFGLAGTVGMLREASPFELRPPNPAWSRALHGFGWLRHLEATGDLDARETARALTVEWTLREHTADQAAWEPAVMGRRIISWLSHANFLLDDADVATYDAITRSLGGQLIRLSASWRDGPDGYPRLLAVTALVLADLCIAGHERRLEGVERYFIAELQRQLLPDGGHVSRNPAVLVDLMLDLLPVRQCFAARGRRPPEVLLEGLANMVAMLRYMRLGDGRLARFNGTAVASPAGLATVLAYDDRVGQAMRAARESCYVRLACGGTVVIADSGSAPPFEFANEAHAGCLSFEMSAGSRLIFVNGGAPGPADLDWRAAARSTANHNTLALAESSSARLVRHARLETLLGAPPIRGPGHVHSKVVDLNGDLVWTADHDGYYGRHGLIHKRTLKLSASGGQIEGADELTGSGIGLRLRTDLPFAIHFHLHPDISCRLASDAETAELSTPEGQTWQFKVQGAALSIEESTYFADSSGPRRALQFVLRGTTFGETTVRWQLRTRA